MLGTSSVVVTGETSKVFERMGLLLLTVKKFLGALRSTCTLAAHTARIKLYIYLDTGILLPNSNLTFFSLSDAHGDFGFLLSSFLYLSMIRHPSPCDL